MDSPDNPDSQDVVTGLAAHVAVFTAGPEGDFTGLKPQVFPRGIAVALVLGVDFGPPPPWFGRIEAPACARAAQVGGSVYYYCDRPVGHTDRNLGIGQHRAVTDNDRGITLAWSDEECL